MANLTRHLVSISEELFGSWFLIDICHYLSNKKKKQQQTNLVLLVHPGLELLAGLQLAEHLGEGVVAQGGVGGQGGVVADLILI